MKRIASAVLMAAAGLGAISACSSTTAGNGSAGAAVADSSSSASEAPASSSSVTAPIAPASPASSTSGGANSGGANSGGANSGGSTGGGSTTTATHSPGPVTRPAAIGSVTNGKPTCTSKTDTHGTVKISWTSKGSTSVWVLEGGVPSVLVNSDAKADGGKGPFGGSGSATMPFSCADVNDSYLVEAYNANDNTHSGEVVQVPYPA